MASRSSGKWLTRPSAEEEEGTREVGGRASRESNPCAQRQTSPVRVFP